MRPASKLKAAHANYGNPNVQTYGAHVFAMDMLSSVSHTSEDKAMQQMAFY